MIIAGNQQLLKSANRIAILRKIRMRPGLSRAELAQEVALTKSTVGKLVEDLISEGWLSETRVVVTGKLGRRPTPLYLDSSRRLLIGASINGLSSEVVAMSLGGKVKELSIMDASGSVEGVLDTLAGQICELYRKFSSAGYEIYGIGVAAPGPVGPDTGVLRHSESTGWREVPMRDMLKERLRQLGVPDVELVIERAVGCIALQHFEFERSKDEGPIVYVHIGHAIAASAIIGQQVVRGRNGLAGFCAHLPVETDGPLCDCGQRGCANVVLTLRAMERERGVDTDTMRALAASGDEHALEVMRRTGEKLGAFLFNLCLQYDPARMFVGGPAFQLGCDFIRGAQSRLDQLAALAGHQVPPRLEVMRFDRHNVALGAATTVLHKLLSAAVTPT